MAASGSSTAHAVQQAGSVIIRARPRTEIGPQGDHVTPFVLFKEFLESLPKEDPNAAISEIIYAMSNMENCLKIYQKQLGGDWDKEKREQFDSQVKKYSEISITIIDYAKEQGKN